MPSEAIILSDKLLPQTTMQIAENNFS